MQLVADGPDIPPELFQKLEDDELVLFCGAGLSMGAGLCDFKTLVKKVIHKTGVVNVGDPEKDQLDQILQQIEDQIGPVMRRTVIQILSRPPKGIGVSSHRAVLELARLKAGQFRCITTNFDDYFKRACRIPPPIMASVDTSPKLPVPKPGKWTSLVHLHGQIAKLDPDGSNLVLTSADFGTAYLTEGWAARFMTEVFRHSSVLFIGYSIEDPVMRYLLDALAADRRLKTGPKDAYALVSYSVDEDKQKTLTALTSRGVKPIFYHDRNRHDLLHKTLERWAERKKGGLTARTDLIKALAPNDPTGLGPEERDNLAWAISEPSGFSARIFASGEPLPPIGWLKVFEESEHNLRLTMRGTKSDSGAVAVADTSDRLNRGRLERPTFHLAGWLCRHLSEPELLTWVLDSGGLLHSEFKDLIQTTISRQQCPMPRALKRIWEVLASDPPVVAYARPTYNWNLRVDLENGLWNESLKVQLLQSLEPYLKLSPQNEALKELRLNVSQSLADIPATAFVSGEVLIPASHEGREILTTIKNGAHDKVLAELAHELTGLLRKAFDLYAFLGEASADFDLSYVCRPSLTPDPQNTNFEDWTVLIDFLLASFERLEDQNTVAARALITRWASEDYPIFKRLALHGATIMKNLEPNERLRLFLVR